MKITVFGTTEELESVKRAAEEIPMLQYRKLLWENAQDYDALMRGGALRLQVGDRRKSRRGNAVISEEFLPWYRLR